VWRDPELILVRAAREPGVVVASLGTRSFEGGAHHALRITRGDGEVSAVLYLDPGTHLVRAMTYTEDGSETVERYDDYKRVSGIQVAHRRQTRNADTVLDLTVTELRFDAPLSPELFTRP
jgi:hypothetical protein